MASTETATLTADTVIVTRGHDDMPLVWLIRTVKPAFQGHWAIPGGKLVVGETFTEAAVREAAEETHLRVAEHELRFLGYYDAPDRDPRGRYVSVTFLIEIDSERAAELRPGSDAIEGRWWSLDGFPDIIARIVATTPGVRRTAEFVGGAFLYRVLCSRCCPGLALHPIAESRDPAEAETAYNDHVILHDLEREAAQ